MADEPPSKRARSEATGQELPAAFSAALGRALDGAAPGEAFRGAAPWPHMQVRTQVPQSAVGAKSARPGGEGALRGAARREVATHIASGVAAALLYTAARRAQA